MSTIEPKAYTPSEIKTIKFRIPLYQRPYAWEAKQVLQLLEDLLKASLSEEHYYIGILSIGKTEADNDLFDLIDGQQRITTLTLIGRVLIDFNVNWKLFLENRLDLYGRDEDKQYLDSLKEDSNPNPKMIEAIKTVNFFLKDKSESDKAVFSEYVYNHAAFFLSEVPSDYTVIEKNLQFVRMNNRGKQLEAHDILKMKLASKIISNSDARTKFVNKWNDISQMGCKTNDDSKQEEIASKTLIEILNDVNITKSEPKETEIFYQSIVSFPEFLLIALSRFNFGDAQNSNYRKVSHKKEKLLEEFGFGIGDIWTEDSLLKFMVFLENQFELFKKFFIKRDKEENYKLPLDKDNEQFFKSESISELIEKLKMFQSFMYVCIEPHNWLIDAFDFLKDSEKINANDFLIRLKEIDNELQKNTTNISLNYGDNRLRYWFWRLDYYLWEKRNDLFKEEHLKTVEKYVFRINRSIEHLHPRDESQNQIWGDNNTINSFGNLAMISSSFNSTQSNDNVAVKFGRIKEQIERKSLESIKLLLMYERANKEEKGWTKAIAQEHENEMREILSNSFPNEGYEKIKSELNPPNKSNTL